MTLKRKKEEDSVVGLTEIEQPFKTNLVNASFLVVSSLPPSVEMPSASSPSRRLSIHAHPTPIRVSYSTVSAIVPEIMEEFAQKHNGRQPDLILHTGIAPPRNYYSVETRAHRDAYNEPDIDGRMAYEDGEKVWKELNLPPMLVPMSKSMDEFLDVWKSYAPAGTDLRISHDAGRYSCEFIYYTSLALAELQGRDHNVMFFHLPPSYQEEDIELGRKTALALIKTLVTCWIDREKP